MISHARREKREGTNHVGVEGTETVVGVVSVEGVPNVGDQVGPSSTMGSVVGQPLHVGSSMSDGCPMVGMPIVGTPIVGVSTVGKNHVGVLSGDPPVGLLEGLAVVGECVVGVRVLGSGVGSPTNSSVGVGATVFVGASVGVWVGSGVQSGECVGAAVGAT